MAMKRSGKLLLGATKPVLGANPYYMMPKDSTKTVLRENWRFTGAWMMNSQREQIEYRTRNKSYGNFAIWWQGHFDAIFTVVMCAATTIYFCTCFGYQWVRSFGYNNDRQRAIYQVLQSLGTKWGGPGAVWFEEEARQKKIGLFME